MRVQTRECLNCGHRWQLSAKEARKRPRASAMILGGSIGLVAGLGLAQQRRANDTCPSCGSVGVYLRV